MKSAFEQQRVTRLQQEAYERQQAEIRAAKQREWEAAQREREQVTEATRQYQAAENARRKQASKAFWLTVENISGWLSAFIVIMTPGPIGFIDFNDTEAMGVPWFLFIIFMGLSTRYGLKQLLGTRPIQ